MNKIKDNGVSPVIGTILLVALSIILISLISISVMSAADSFTPVENKVVGFTVQVNASNNSALITPVSGTDLPFLLSYRVYTDNGHWDKPDAGSLTVPNFNSAVTYVNIVGNFTDEVTGLVFSGKVVVEGGVIVVTPTPTPVTPTPTLTPTPVTPTPTPVPTPSPYYTTGNNTSTGFTSLPDFVTSLNNWSNNLYGEDVAILFGVNNNNIAFYGDVPIGNEPIRITSEMVAGLSDNTLVLNNYGSPTLSEVQFTRAPGYEGELLVISSGAKLQTTGATLKLDGMGHGSAPLLAIASGGSLEVNGKITLINNTNPTGNGGAVSNNGAMSVSTNLIIYNNTAKNGAGLYNTGTSFSITACDIYDNEASEKGGGIYNALGSTVPMNNGNIKVHDNTAADGGGVYNAGTLTGGFPLTNNNAYGNGGGIYNTGTVTFTSGSLLISGNSATNGGGIYNPGTMTIGGPISGNTASEKGGGVYNSGKFTFNSGSISGNLAASGYNYYAKAYSTNNYALYSKFIPATSPPTTDQPVNGTIP